MKFFVKCCICCFAVLLLFSDLFANDKKNNYAKSKISNRGSRNCGDKLNVLYRALRNYADLHNGQLPAKNNFEGLKELFAYGVTKEDLHCRHYGGPRYHFDYDRDFAEKRQKWLDEVADLKKRGKDISKLKEPKYDPKKEKFAEKHSGYIYFGSINLAAARTKVPKMIIMADKISKSRKKSDPITVLTADGIVTEIKQDKLEREKITTTVGLVEYMRNIYKYPQDIYRVLRNRAANIDAELKKIQARKK